MPFTRHCLGVLIGLNAAFILKGVNTLSLHPFTEASKVGRKSWVALHQGGGRFRRRVRFLRERSSPGPRGKHWPGRRLEMLKFGCSGGGVTDLVSFVLHTP